MDEYRGKGLWTAVARQIKDAVDVPVITAGRMDENLAERVLEAGDADVIALGRTLWADPWFARKVDEGVSTRSCVARVARAAKIRSRNRASAA